MSKITRLKLPELDKTSAVLLLFNFIGVCYFGLQNKADVMLLFILFISALVFCRRLETLETEAVVVSTIPSLLKVVLLYFGIALFVIKASFIEIGIFLEFLLLNVLAASGEESFRAILYETIAKIKNTKPSRLSWFAIFVSDIVWVGFHFIQRQFMFTVDVLLYALWLFLTGIVLGLTYYKYGLQTAILAHFLLNLV